MWYNLSASRLTGALEEEAVNGRDEIANKLNPNRSPKRNASPASGTPRTRVSRRPHIDPPARQR